MKNILLKSFGTHDGTFHADEVTACSLLIFFELVRKDLVFRTRDNDVLKKCEYICDVGGEYNPKNKKFDHHQINYGGNLSSAGMVLLYLKEEKIISKDFYEYLNNLFIKGVDLHDIGKIKMQLGISSFSNIISSFSPIEGSSLIEFDKRFFEAVNFVLGYISRLFTRFNYLKKASKIVEENMKKRDKFLVFEKPISWIESFFKNKGESHPALFIIMPTGDKWKLRAIPPSFEDRMNVRLPLPKEWAGLREEDLKKVSKISGAIFCHKGRFISIWETKEDAIKAIKYIFKKENINYENNF